MARETVKRKPITPSLIDVQRRFRDGGGLCTSKRVGCRNCNEIFQRLPIRGCVSVGKIDSVKYDRKEWYGHDSSELFANRRRYWNIRIGANCFLFPFFFFFFLVCAFRGRVYSIEKIILARARTGKRKGAPVWQITTGNYVFVVAKKYSRDTRCNEWQSSAPSITVLNDVLIVLFAASPTAGSDFFLVAGK